MQRKHIKTVVKVFPKATLCNLFNQVSVCRGNHADIQINDFIATQPLKLALLQDTQQLRLQCQGHLGHFVEQDRSAIGLLEFSSPSLMCAGVGALLITKQHRFEHVFGDSGTVHSDERLVNPY